MDRVLTIEAPERGGVIDLLDVHSSVKVTIDGGRLLIEVRTSTGPNDYAPASHDFVVDLPEQDPEEEDDSGDEDTELVVTPEQGEPVTAPASYFLDNWYGHSTAERVIQECAEYGTPGSWETPQGVMMVRRV